MNTTTNATTTNASTSNASTTKATSASCFAPRATALAMAFTVTLLMFGGIDGLAHAPEAGSLLAAAPSGTTTTTGVTTATAQVGSVLSSRG